MVLPVAGVAEGVGRVGVLVKKRVLIDVAGQAYPATAEWFPGWCAYEGRMSLGWTVARIPEGPVAVIAVLTGLHRDVAISIAMDLRAEVRSPMLDIPAEDLRLVEIVLDEWCGGTNMRTAARRVHVVVRRIRRELEMRTGPLSTSCPRCGVDAGEQCEATHAKHGLLWRPKIGRPHRDRVRAAKEPANQR